MSDNRTVPRVIDYAEVQAFCAAAGLVSLYPNSGAFGFGNAAGVSHVGWLLTEDASIRPAARALAELVAGDCSTLADRARAFWRSSGEPMVWLLPKSHWAYELTFGNADWLGDALKSAEINPAVLADRHDGSAVEFLVSEADELATLLAVMLQNLAQSDFELIFASGQTLCTVHHHKQLWWSTRDVGVADALRAIA